jgi:hypothetical protein
MELACKASADHKCKVKSNVFLFGRIRIGNLALHPLLLLSLFNSGSNDSNMHAIQHSKPYRVPLGGDPVHCIQPHVVSVSAGPFHAAIVTCAGDVYASVSILCYQP